MRISLVIVTSLLACPVFAADVQVYKLTPEQKAAAIASASGQPERAALLLMPNPEPGSLGLVPSSKRDAVLSSSLYGTVPLDNKMHGEIGMFVGSGGARGIYGTTAVPLGENGTASFSFGSSRLPVWNSWDQRIVGPRR